MKYDGLISTCSNEPDLMNDIVISRDHFTQHFVMKYAPPSATSVINSPTVLGSAPADDFDFFPDIPSVAPLTAEQEVLQYFALPRESRDCDPVKWWASRVSQFPNLSRFARDILSIPGMHNHMCLSVPCSRMPRFCCVSRAGLLWWTGCYFTSSCTTHAEHHPCNHDCQAQFTASSGAHEGRSRTC
jgi:hypothetical protein